MEILEEFNGINIDDKYMYIVTDQFPYVSRCLMGEVTQEEPRGQHILLNRLDVSVMLNYDKKLEFSVIN